MLDESHTTIARPAPLVVVPDDIVVRRARGGSEVTLDEVTRFIGREAEKNVDAVDIVRVETNRMTCLCSRATVLQEVVRRLWGTGRDLCSALQTKDGDIEDEVIVLEDEGRELKTTNETVCICVRHVWGCG